MTYVTFEIRHAGRPPVQAKGPCADESPTMHLASHGTFRSCGSVLELHLLDVFIQVHALALGLLSEHSCLKDANAGLLL